MQTAGATDGDASSPEAASGRSDGRSIRWLKHRDQRRAAIVAGGVIAIDMYGPDASAAQIADAAGVSRTVLYRYFHDKDDLQRSIAAHIVHSVLVTFTPLIRIDSTSTPRSIIRSATTAVFTFLEAHANQYLFLRQQRAVHGESLATVETNLAAQVANLLQAVITYYGMDEAHAEPVAHGVIGLVEASAGWWTANRALTSEQMIDFISSSVWFVLDGQLRAYGRVLDPDKPLPFA